MVCASGKKAKRSLNNDPKDSGRTRKKIRKLIRDRGGKGTILYYSPTGGNTPFSIRKECAIDPSGGTRLSRHGTGGDCRSNLSEKGYVAAPIEGGGKFTHRYEWTNPLVILWPDGGGTALSLSALGEKSRTSYSTYRGKVQRASFEESIRHLSLWLRGREGDVLCRHHVWGPLVGRSLKKTGGVPHQIWISQRVRRGRRELKGQKMTCFAGRKRGDLPRRRSRGCALKEKRRNESRRYKLLREGWSMTCWVKKRRSKIEGKVSTSKRTRVSASRESLAHHGRRGKGGKRKNERMKKKPDDALAEQNCRAVPLVLRKETFRSDLCRTNSGEGGCPLPSHQDIK